MGHKQVNKKKIIIITLIVLILGSISLAHFFTKEDKETSLTVSDKKWIEDNRNSVIDFSALNGIPVISDNGNGLIFDFLTSLEEDTDLEFNKLSYEKEENGTAGYVISKKSKLDKNDILLYQDDYVLVSKEKNYYLKASELKNMNIGLLTDDLENIQTYLKEGYNLTFKTYETFENLNTALNNGEINVIALPRLDYLKDILENDLNIVFNINDYKINYAITLGNNERLNKILTKYFNAWKENDYREFLRSHIINSYFTYQEISEREQTEFRSRRYTYGFVVNAPYDVKINGSLKGFNHTLINDFALASGIEVDYKQYSSIESMLKDFNNKQVDIISGNIKDLDKKLYHTVPIYDNEISIISNSETELTVESINSLKEKTLLVIKDSKIEEVLKENNIKVKEYDNIQDLISNIKDDSIAAIDSYTYDYYVRQELKNYKNLGNIDIENSNGFITKNEKDLKNLNNFFNFYLSFINIKELTNSSYNNLILTNNNTKNLRLILSCLVIVLLAIIAIITKIILGKKKDINSKLSKTDKLRYVDSLTSLKNRNYLNDNMAKWDSSEAYPQSVIIIDLNNIAYINDNFGHTEGDKVIVEAASILINNQLSGSELLRTNGNEFLVFTVGHDEKSVVTYIRKLNKEFKELSHGFGAAIGYSMITDEIKTIDDAINEATLDMRSNKEEIKS